MSPDELTLAKWVRTVPAYLTTCIYIHEDEDKIKRYNEISIGYEHQNSSEPAQMSISLLGLTCESKVTIPFTQPPSGDITLLRYFEGGVMKVDKGVRMIADWYLPRIARDDIGHYTYLGLIEKGNMIVRMIRHKYTRTVGYELEPDQR